jgi:hypothetical protein
MKSLSPLAFALMAAALILGTICTFALADPPLPPPVPDLPSAVGLDSDPVFIRGVSTDVVDPALSPKFEPGIYEKEGRYYKQRKGVTLVYSNVCNGRSCSPGWYPVSTQALVKSNRTSGYSGESAGCSGSSSRRERGPVLRGRFRLGLRGCS